MIEELHCIPEDLAEDPSSHSARNQLTRAIMLYNLQAVVQTERLRRTTPPNPQTTEEAHTEPQTLPERVDSHTETELVPSEEEEAAQRSDDPDSSTVQQAPQALDGVETPTEETKRNVEEDEHIPEVAEFQSGAVHAIQRSELDLDNRPKGKGKGKKKKRLWGASTQQPEKKQNDSSKWLRRWRHAPWFDRRSIVLRQSPTEDETFPDFEGVCFDRETDPSQPSWKMVTMAVLQETQMLDIACARQLTVASKAWAGERPVCFTLITEKAPAHSDRQQAILGAPFGVISLSERALQVYRSLQEPPVPSITAQATAADGSQPFHILQEQVRASMEWSPTPDRYLCEVELGALSTPPTECLNANHGELVRDLLPGIVFPFTTRDLPGRFGGVLGQVRRKWSVLWEKVRQPSQHANFLALRQRRKQACQTRVHMSIHITVDCGCYRAGRQDMYTLGHRRFTSK